jgi:hypothetical protein
MDNTKVGLAHPAYQGAPKPLGNNILGKEDLELPRYEPKWNFKPRKVRKAELLATL